MKYIKLFNSKEELVNKIKSGEWYVPNVSYAEEDDEIVFDEEVFNASSNAPLWTTLHNNNLVHLSSSAVTKYELSMVTDDDFFITVTSSSDGSEVTSVTSIFSNDTDLVTFNELKNFENITQIGVSMFKGCSSLKSVMLPKNITAIKSHAFHGCSALTSINWDNITSIGDSAFYSCSQLGVMDLPEGLKTIGNYAFHNCTNLDVSLPASLETIGVGAFVGCEALITVVIPEKVTKIPRRAFANCPNIETLTIPATVSSLGAGILYGCEYIETINYGSTSDDWNALIANSDAAWANGMSMIPTIVCTDKSFKLETDDGATYEDDGSTDDYTGE